MILNGPAFFGWHRPIVLQGFFWRHTPPSVSNARKMFNLAVRDFFLFFIPSHGVTRTVENSAHFARHKLPCRYWNVYGCFPMIKIHSHNRSIRYHTSAVLMHWTLKVPFKVAGLCFTRDLGGLYSYKGVCKPSLCFKKKKGNLSRISLLEWSTVNKIKQSLEFKAYSIIIFF